jgi:2-haloacid dehalogenase
MNQYACLSPFPENLGALQALKDAGVPTAILSNGTPEMLGWPSRAPACTAFSTTCCRWMPCASTRPVPTPTRWPGSLRLPCRAHPVRVVQRLGRRRRRWFGFTTFWINRSGQPLERWTWPHRPGRLLTDVVDFVARHRA